MSTLHCPAHLTTDTRVAFRTQALAALDTALADGHATVTLDLGAVVEIDASGLGVLILLQKRARERHVRVCLLRVPGLVERLLDDTRMSALFDIVRES
jgi:anti-anti-sigma factor